MRATDGKYFDQKGLITCANCYAKRFEDVIFIYESILIHITVAKVQTVEHAKSQYRASTLKPMATNIMKRALFAHRVDVHLKEENI